MSSDEEGARQLGHGGGQSVLAEVGGPSPWWVKAVHHSRPSLHPCAGLTSRMGLKSHAPSGARGGAGGKSKRAHRRAHSPPLRGRADTASFENLGGSEDDNDASVHMLLSELDVEVLEEG